jgi:hypothetical protein
MRSFAANDNNCRTGAKKRVNRCQFTRSFRGGRESVFVTFFAVLADIETHGFNFQ